MAATTAWNAKRRRMIRSAVDDYVERHTAMVGVRPDRCVLFAEDYDEFDADARHTLGRYRGLRLIRGPSRAEYRV